MKLKFFGILDHIYWQLFTYFYHNKFLFLEYTVDWDSKVLWNAGNDLSIDIPECPKRNNIKFDSFFLSNLPNNFTELFSSHF